LVGRFQECLINSGLAVLILRDGVNRVA
jgi:hypothetical protein